MARPRFDRLSPERQRVILAAAESEFAAHGYTGASLNRIIKAASLSKGVFYYYFDDKVDLATTVFERATSAVVGSVRSFSPPEGDVDFWESFESIVRATMENLRNAPRQTDAVSRLGMAIVSDPELGARLQATMRVWTRAAAKYWRRGQELGAVRTDFSPEALVILLQGVKEALARVLLPTNRAPTQRELDRFIECQLDFFRRVASPSMPRAARKPRRAGAMLRASRQEVRQ
jgi:AcrR family transcriptional regulator